MRDGSEMREKANLKSRICTGKETERDIAGDEDKVENLYEKAKIPHQKNSKQKYNCETVISIKIL
jgi:hypothetical protein